MTGVDNQMQLIFDESGQPFILMREQEKQKRLRGVEALKVRINLIFIKKKTIF